MSNSKKTGMRLNPTQAFSIASLLSRKINDLDKIIIGNNQKQVDTLVALIIKKFHLTSFLTLIQKAPAKTEVSIKLADLASYKCEVDLTPASKLKSLQDDVKDVVTSILDDGFKYVSTEEIKNRLIRDSVMKPFSADLENDVLNYYQTQKMAEFKSAYELVYKKLK